jgi:Cu/Ag efflux protein CusF
MDARLFSMILAGAAALFGASSAHCSHPAAPARPDAGAARSYATRGVVRAFDPDKKTVLLAHEDIPGFMKAMTMQFDLRDAGLVKGLSVGDKVSFSFTDEGDGRLVVQSIQKAAP